ncbi:phage tail tape measure protein, partial [Microbacterium sp. NPDC078814]|uniref:phage tail tape measure protein n=1 Tax=Microbacterium sp. NPDC078814 TaxID=3154767 RepID=UPI00344E2D7E
MSERVVKVRLAAQVSDYEKGMLEAARATRTVGTEAEKLAQKKEAFERVGQGLVLTGTALTAIAALSVKAAIDWETAWAGVTKTVDGNEQQMAELEDGLRSLAQTLPATHQEIAAVAEAAGQLGVAREDVVDFTKTMIDLSETTNLTADEAATSIAQLMNVMQTTPEDVDNLGAALVALGNDGASTERDIIQMAQRIAGAGRVVGLTEAQVLGFANALASVGIEAEAGGSAISRIMTDIAMSVSNGGEKLDEPGVPRGGGLSGPRRRDRDGVSHRAMVSENDQ